MAPFPLYAAILTVFAHELQGATAATAVVRGLLLGLFGFAGFFFVLATMIERLGVGAAFTAAVVVTLAVQGGSLGLLRATSR